MPSPPPTTAKARAPRLSRHPRSRWGTKSPAGWIGYGSSDFGAHRSKIPLLARSLPKSVPASALIFQSLLPIRPHSLRKVDWAAMPRKEEAAAQERKSTARERQAATDGRRGVPAALGRSGASPAMPTSAVHYPTLIMGLHSYGCMCTVSFVCM